MLDMAGAQAIRTACTLHHRAVRRAASAHQERDTDHDLEPQDRDLVGLPVLEHIEQRITA
jgi:hypothetical protein